jgi:hypothetical protein
MKQLIFIGAEPDREVNCICIGYVNPEKWYRWKDDWVRESWCGKFPDGTPRPPWLDDQFFYLWETEGPDAARDKTRYDLSVVTDVAVS